MYSFVLDSLLLPSSDQLHIFLLLISGMDLRFSLASSEALANLFLKTLTRTSAAITAATPLLFCCITVLTASSFDCAGAMVKEERGGGSGGFSAEREEGGEWEGR